MKNEKYRSSSNNEERLFIPKFNYYYQLILITLLLSAKSLFAEENHLNPWILSDGVRDIGSKDGVMEYTLDFSETRTIKVGYYYASFLDKDTTGVVKPNVVDYTIPNPGEERYPFSMTFADGDPGGISIADSVKYYTEILGRSGYPYEKLINKILPDFFYEMTKGKVIIEPFHFKKPNHDTGVWVIQKISDDPTLSEEVEDELTAIEDEISLVYPEKYQEIFNSPDQDAKVVQFCAGYGNTRNCGWVDNYGVKYNRVHFTPSRGGGLTNAVHELGHSILALRDRGCSGSGTQYSGLENYIRVDQNGDGSFTDDERLGIFRSITGVYDLMYHNGLMVPRYAIGSLVPFLTYDMVKIGCIDTDEIHDNCTNRESYRIKAVRQDLTPSDRANNIKWGIKVKFDIDKNYNKAYPMGRVNRNAPQLFFIEYRDGSSYDRAFHTYNDSLPNRGVMISHIIENSGDDIYRTDIELANAYPEYDSVGALYRDPAKADTSNYAPIPRNGLLYNGQRANDWLDDQRIGKDPDYRPEGGKHWTWDYSGYNRPDDSWWHTNSLETDFYVDDDPNRDSFTPSSNPSTESWLMQDTHIAVFVKSIDGEYADINIYRNYWSKPIVETSIETDPNIEECYFGENFTISSGSTFKINGNGFVVEKGVMVVESGATLQLSDNTTLTIEENSSIILQPGAIVKYGSNAKIYIDSYGKIEGVGTPTDRISFVGSSDQYCCIETNIFGSIKLNNIDADNPKYFLKGNSLDECSIRDINITNCLYGVYLTNSDNFSIHSSHFEGRGGGDEGAAITAVQSNGVISNNSITNFKNGINLISSSPRVYENHIYSNLGFGVETIGSNTLPDLGHPNYQIADEFINNSIEDNGEGAILLGGESTIRLSGGYNNIYAKDGTPLISKEVIDSQTPILANGNYWGTDSVTETMFSPESNWIDFNPYSETPFPNSTPVDLTPQEYQLVKASLVEPGVDRSQSEDIYMEVINNYPDTDTAYRGLIELYNLYHKESLDFTKLEAIYNSFLNDIDWRRKKFLKEMIIKTKISNRDYSSAIAIAESMKSSTESGREELIADINITIAKSLIDGKNSDKIGSLVNQLLGNEIYQNSSSDDENLPTKSKLYQNYPNPFNPTTTITYSLSYETDVGLVVMDILGREVGSYSRGREVRGDHKINFDGSKLSSGVYFYSLILDGSKFSTKKMILVK